MTIVKTRSGRFTAKLKSGRQFVASKTFDTKREATEWLARERAALAGGVDPRAGRQRVGALLEHWLTIRRATVATKTYRADQALQRLVPTGMQALQVGAVTSREVARSFDLLLGSGLAEQSVVRYRASLSSFFGWCVRERIIGSNPVTGVPVPRSSEEQVEMRPWTEAELEAVFQRWQQEDPHLADVMLLLGWTGLRWGEARALLVEDLVEVPTPGLLVRRSAPEGVGTKATKGRRSRRVPLANRVLPIAHRLADDKVANDLLVTTAGGARCTDPRFSAPCTGPRRARAAACTTCGTPQRASGSPAAWTRAPCRPGWGTSRSRRRTGTCTSSAPRPTRPASIGSTSPDREVAADPPVSPARKTSLCGDRGNRCSPGVRRGYATGRWPRITRLRYATRERQRPRSATWAFLVELRGFEPLTFSLRTRRATNCATAPSGGKR